MSREIPQDLDEFLNKRTSYPSHSNAYSVNKIKKYHSKFDQFKFLSLHSIIDDDRFEKVVFFNIVFLLSLKVKPNYDYLRLKVNIGEPRKLKERILETCAKLDMKATAKDVSPFLFNPADSKKIELFEQYISQVEL